MALCTVPVLYQTHKSTPSLVDIHMAKLTAAGQQDHQRPRSGGVVGGGSLLSNVCPSSSLAGSACSPRTDGAKEMSTVFSPSPSDSPTPLIVSTLFKQNSPVNHH